MSAPRFENVDVQLRAVPCVLHAVHECETPLVRTVPRVLHETHACAPRAGEKMIAVPRDDVHALVAGGGGGGRIGGSDSLDANAEAVVAATAAGEARAAEEAWAAEDAEAEAEAEAARRVSFFAAEKAAEERATAASAAAAKMAAAEEEAEVAKKAAIAAAERDAVVKAVAEERERAAKAAAEEEAEIAKRDAAAAAEKAAAKKAAAEERERVAKVAAEQEAAAARRAEVAAAEKAAIERALAEERERAAKAAAEVEAEAARRAELAAAEKAAADKALAEEQERAAKAAKAAEDAAVAKRAAIAAAEKEAAEKSAAERRERAKAVKAARVKAEKAKAAAAAKAVEAAKKAAEEAAKAVEIAAIAAARAAEDVAAAEKIAAESEAEAEREAALDEEAEQLRLAEETKATQEALEAQEAEKVRASLVAAEDLAVVEKLATEAAALEEVSLDKTEEVCVDQPAASEVIEVSLPTSTSLEEITIVEEVCVEEFADFDVVAVEFVAAQSLTKEAVVEQRRADKTAASEVIADESAAAEASPTYSADAMSGPSRVESGPVSRLSAAPVVRSLMQPMAVPVPFQAAQPVARKFERFSATRDTPLRPVVDQPSSDTAPIIGSSGNGWSKAVTQRNSPRLGESTLFAPFHAFSAGFVPETAVGPSVVDEFDSSFGNRTGSDDVSDPPLSGRSGHQKFSRAASDSSDSNSFASGTMRVREEALPDVPPLVAQLPAVFERMPETRMNAFDPNRSCPGELFGHGTGERDSLFRNRAVMTATPRKPMLAASTKIGDCVLSSNAYQPDSSSCEIVDVEEVPELVDHPMSALVSNPVTRTPAATESESAKSQTKELHSKAQTHEGRRNEMEISLDEVLGVEGAAGRKVPTPNSPVPGSAGSSSSDIDAPELSVGSVSALSNMSDMDEDEILWEEIVASSEHVMKRVITEQNLRQQPYHSEISSVSEEQARETLGADAKLADDLESSDRLTGQPTISNGLHRSAPPLQLAVLRADSTSAAAGALACPGDANSRSVSDTAHKCTRTDPSLPHSMKDGILFSDHGPFGTSTLESSRFVAVLGAETFLGTHVVKTLLKGGRRKVKALVCSEEVGRFEFLTHLCGKYGGHLQIEDIGPLSLETSQVHLRWALRGVDVIVNCAELFSRGKPGRAADQSFASVRNLSRAISASGSSVTRLVHAGSDQAVWNPCDASADSSIDERCWFSYSDSSGRKYAHPEAYAVTAAEIYLWSKASDAPYSMVVVNSSLLLGPGLSPFHSSEPGMQLLLGILSSSFPPSILSPVVDVRDVATLVTRLCTSHLGVCGRIIASAEVLTTDSVAKKLGDLYADCEVRSRQDTGRGKKFWRPAATDVRFPYMLSKRGVKERTRTARLYKVSSHRARREVNIRFRPSEESMKESVDFLSASGFVDVSANDGRLSRSQSGAIRRSGRLSTRLSLQGKEETRLVLKKKSRISSLN